MLDLSSTILFLDIDQYNYNAAALETPAITPLYRGAVKSAARATKQQKGAAK